MSIRNIITYIGSDEPSDPQVGETWLDTNNVFRIYRGDSGGYPGWREKLAHRSIPDVWGWGNNNYGKLGDGTTATGNVPVSTLKASHVVKVATGFDHSIALKADGTLWAWGQGIYGTFGDGLLQNSTIPVQVPDLDNVVDVFSGRWHCFATKLDGTLWAWGFINYGRLGTGDDGPNSQLSVPTQVTGISDVKQVACGTFHTLAVKKDGAVWSWGKNNFGQLGLGTSGTPIWHAGTQDWEGGDEENSLVPVTVVDETGTVPLSGAKAVGCGENFSLVVKNDGTVLSFGWNTYGQLGDGTSGNTEHKSTPVQVLGITDVIAVEAGNHFSIALKTDGTVWGWGKNDLGAVGDGLGVSVTTPVQVVGLDSITKITCGSESAFARRIDGKVFAWGKNDNGQLGLGDLHDRLSPDILGITNITDITSLSDHTLAVKGSKVFYPSLRDTFSSSGPRGGLWVWGRNSSGQLGNGETTNILDPIDLDKADLIDVSLGTGFTLGLHSGGSVSAWGNNSVGQLGDETTTNRGTAVSVSSLTDVSVIRAGNTGSNSTDYSTAIKSDGTVWFWGWNHLQSQNVVTPTQVYDQVLTDIVDLAAGKQHIIAIDSTGLAYGWGSNSNGQIGENQFIPIPGGTTTPTPFLTNIWKVTAAFTHSALITGSSGGEVKFLGRRVDGVDETAATTYLTGGADVSAAALYTIALKTDGTVWGWGSNSFGQLGDGTVINKVNPVQVSGLTDIVKISAGGSYNIALKNDGTVWSWGRNVEGQLGDGTNTQRLIPVQVNNVRGIGVLSAGGYHVAALTA